MFLISKIQENYFFFIFSKTSVGPKDLGTPAHLISNLRPTPRRKKCPRTNEGNPDR